MSDDLNKLAHLNTEAVDSRFANIDSLNDLELLSAFNESDKSVPLAVEKVLPAIAQAVTSITARMSQGGRLIYVGAGTSGRLGVLDASECIPTFSIKPGLVVALIAGGDHASRNAVEGAEDKIDGFKPDSDEYYEKINATMRQRFPDYFDSDDGNVPVTNQKPPSTVVAPSNRSNGAKPRKIQLSASQVSLAKRLGLTPALS